MLLWPSKGHAKPYGNSHGKILLCSVQEHGVSYLFPPAPFCRDDVRKEVWPRKLLLSSFSWLWQRPFYSRVNDRDLDATLNLQGCLRGPQKDQIMWQIMKYSLGITENLTLTFGCFEQHLRLELYWQDLGMGLVCSKRLVVNAQLWKKKHGKVPGLIAESICQTIFALFLL